MGSKSRMRKKYSNDDMTTLSSSSLSSSSTSDDTDHSSRRRYHHHRRHRRGDRSSRKEKERRREKEEKRRKKRERRRKSGREHKKKRKRGYSSGNDSEDHGSGSDDVLEPEEVVQDMLREFPKVGDDLTHLLKMIDDGQAVDIKGISERSLVKHLEKLFTALNLEEDGDRIFLLPSRARPTLELVGPLIQANSQLRQQKLDCTVPVKETCSPQAEGEPEQEMNDSNQAMPPKDVSIAPKKRMIGPEMPSAELLAVAAKLTEAQAELKEAELEEDTELFIGPPPPAMVAEAATANEAERFEEVTRIMTADVNCPYDTLGVNQKMSADNIKKRYWKLSLLVHPDKCPHPQAHQAFIILNKAFKELQDPDKRKELDDKIKRKEEQEEMEAELKTMREAAKWRRSQGISMEGDDELLKMTDVESKVAPKRDEWMTTLPPERKPGMTMHSTTFSRTSKEGRGDTSVWTDTPSDRAQKAKTNYLEAYNQAAALAFKEDEKKKTSLDAELVDQYNKAKRSKSLVQKHKEEAANRSKKKSKQQPEKEEWEGKHPWRPWDREKDLVAGRQSIKFDPENMAQGLSTRFSSGTFQRNFL